MNYLAARYRAIIDEHGPDAVAFYGSGQLTTEEYYVANKLAKGFLGTNNFDTNSRLCMASAAVGYKTSLGSDGPPASYADIDLADCFLLIGTNTVRLSSGDFQTDQATKIIRPQESDDHRHRSAPHGDRRFRRSASADPTRHRHRSAQQYARVS